MVLLWRAILYQLETDVIINFRVAAQPGLRRFDKTTGTMTVSQNPAACAVDISIDTSTINTQVSERDEDLRGPDFFHVTKFPAMTYQGRGIRRDTSFPFGREQLRQRTLDSF
jgi:polyisoprenoid-binding protein YceI